MEQRDFAVDQEMKLGPSARSDLAERSRNRGLLVGEDFKLIDTEENTN